MKVSLHGIKVFHFKFNNITLLSELAINHSFSP